MSWNKGFTKETHPSVLKISLTMREKRLDNFKKWREKAKNEGIIPKTYPRFSPSKNLAELIGVILGDGNIQRYARTEGLLIVGNYNNPGFINRYAKIVRIIFRKKPAIRKVNGENTTRISLYQKNISRRLGIPAGSRKSIKFETPTWILENKSFLVAFLRGLFEAEGSLSVHKPTYTYNFQFRNNNQSLLTAVEKGLKLLGYHPEIRKYAIRLRKKLEVLRFKKQISFRKYK